MNYRNRLYSTYVSTHTSALYGEATAEGTAKQFTSWRYHFHRFLPADRSARIVDIGCGSGGFVRFLRECGYEKAEGVDVSAEQVALSKRLGIEGIVCSDLVEYLSNNPKSFDLVVARDVIEHFKKDEILAVFDAVYQALKHDGQFVIQVPNGESPMSGRIRYGDFTHESSFTETSLRQIYSVTGFRTLTCLPVNPVPKGYKSVARYVFWKGIESLLRFWLLIETGSSRGIFTQNLIAAGKKGCMGTDASEGEGSAELVGTVEIRRS